MQKFREFFRLAKVYAPKVYSETSLKRTLAGQKLLSALERCPLWRGCAMRVSLRKELVRDKMILSVLERCPLYSGFTVVNSLNTDISPLRGLRSSLVLEERRHNVNFPSPQLANNVQVYIIETILEGHEFTTNLHQSLTNLSNLLLKNVNRIIFAHININSIRNKFLLLTSKSSKVVHLQCAQRRTDV